MVITKKPQARTEPAVFLSAALRPKSAVGFDVVHGCLYGADLFSFFVGDFGLEFFLEGHYQFNGVQGIGAQVFHEGRFGFHVFRLNAQLLDNDLLDPFFDAAHDPITLLLMVCKHL
eukprot:gnl/TRDRNA2_/TRDRNA2_176560_c4_seq3.p1 gnl/TRDRNA2_/TRDRNA2_176560_c4~~gnl/TRDRNA2_/TRDRNA2_176560_c4_seq3.p1  ORF type:complete len:116 (+),score=5.87 gnl/TRDRNA2_/TRDRNA2_176560_c4_seq3:59-406(+)